MKDIIKEVLLKAIKQSDPDGLLFVLFLIVVITIVISATGIFKIVELFAK